MPHPRFTNEEIARRGEDIYAARLRNDLEKQYVGQVVIIDIETGDDEIGLDSLAANTRALAKHTGAALYSIRVGFPFVYEFTQRAAFPEKDSAALPVEMGGKDAYPCQTS